MKCEIIRDLMPLVIDECCSEDSAALVREHIAGCGSCRAEFELMRRETPGMTVPARHATKLGRIDEWRASIMQSLALFVSFALITLATGFEAASPEGDGNGAWLFALIIPATAFLLSLANLYFIRVYRSRRAFRIGSLLITAAISAAAFIWGMLHYGVMGSAKTSGDPVIIRSIVIGLALTALACAASFLLANFYAKNLGKE